MKNWKKIIGWVLAAAVVVGVVVFNMHQQQSNTTGKQKVYTIVQLTGPIAEAGKHVKAAMDTWLEMNPDAAFDLVYVDNESRTDKAVTGIQQKTLSDDHPITITVGSIFANIIFPLMKDRGGFNFSIITFNSIVNGYKNVQNISYALPDVVQPMADKINNNYKSVGIISTLDEFGEQQKNYLVKHLNPEIKVSSVAFPLNQQDIRLETQKLLMNNPEVVVVVMTPSLMYQNVLKELKNNFSGKVLVDLTFENTFLNTVAINSNMDVEAVVSKTNLSNTKLKEFEKRLKDKGSYLFYTTKQSYDVLDVINYVMKNNLPFEQNTFEKIGHWLGMSDITFSGKGESSIEYGLVPFKDGKFILAE